jgi:hypothetical protein
MKAGSAKLKAVHHNAAMEGLAGVRFSLVSVLYSRARRSGAESRNIEAGSLASSTWLAAAR